MSGYSPKVRKRPKMSAKQWGWISEMLNRAYEEYPKFKAFEVSAQIAGTLSAIRTLHLSKAVRLIAPVLLAGLMFAAPSFGAIAFDASGGGSNNGGVTTSYAWSHVAAASSVGLVGCVANPTASGGDDFTSVTWDATAMTLDVTVGNVNIATSRWMYFLHINNPTSGSHTVTALFGSTHYVMCVSLTYTGAHLSTQPDNTTSQQSSSSNATTLTTSITTVNDNSWTILLAQGYDATAPPGAGSGSTLRKANDFLGFGNLAIFDSNGAIHPAGANSMTSTEGGSSATGITHILVSIRTPASAVTCKGSLSLLGVGGC